MKKESEPLGAEEIAVLMNRSGSYVRRVLTGAPGAPPPVGAISNRANKGRLMRVWNYNTARAFILEHESRPQSPRSGPRVPADYGFDPDDDDAADDEDHLKRANERFAALLAAELKRGP
jgi:hypothetical protein